MNRYRAMMSLTLAITLGMLLVPPAATAHKVGLYAYLEGGQVRGQAYFAGGGKAVSSPIEVSDGSGKVLGEYNTDGEGNFSFPLPAGVKPPLKLVLKASQGHQASYEMSAEELDLGSAAVQPGAPAAPTPPANPAPLAVPGGSGAGLGPEELRQVVDQALKAQLAPLTAQVAKLAGEREVSVHDIAAGIGYIIGLMGLAAWFLSRRKNN